MSRYICVYTRAYIYNICTQTFMSIQKLAMEDITVMSTP